MKMFNNFKKKCGLFFTAFFLFNFLIAQKNSCFLETLIVKSLCLSNSYSDLKKTIGLLDVNVNSYTYLFNYIPSINPVNPKNSKRISSKFGKRFHPIDKINKPHLGIDISAKLATPVHASASGIIIKVVYSDKGYGNQVLIKHRYGFKTRYAHLHSLIVKKGDSIKKGKIIGFVGNTGKSTACHLHYEVVKNNNHINPEPFLNPLF